MCGIVSVIGDLDIKAEKAFKQMLIFDTVRGEDSTGIIGVAKHNDDVNIAKQVGNPWELFDSLAFKAVNQRSNRALIGHNRYATQGKVNKRNAHPFDFDTLAGVHNGTLTNKHALKDSLKFDVDSENLYHHIEQEGLEAAMKLARGAWALVWWDKLEMTFNVLRNKERPLFYAVTEDRKQMFCASERWMLDVSLTRNDIKYLEPTMFEDGLLHTIAIKKGGELVKPVIRPIEFAAPPVVHVHQPQRRVFDQRANATANSQSSTQGTTNTATNVTKLPVVVKPDNRSKFNQEFLGQKNVLLESVCVVEEKTGAKYVMCFSPQYPFYEIRLYSHSAHQVTLDIGCEFEGDVSQFCQSASDGSGFYKISPHSCKILTPSKLPQEGSTDTDYKDHQGKYLGKAEWEKKYGQCCFCNDLIEAEDQLLGAKLTRNGDSICPQCALEPTLSQYCEIVN